MKLNGGIILLCPDTDTPARLRVLDRITGQICHDGGVRFTVGVYGNGRIHIDLEALALLRSAVGCASTCALQERLEVYPIAGHRTFTCLHTVEGQEVIEEMREALAIAKRPVDHASQHGIGVSDMVAHHLGVPHDGGDGCAKLVRYVGHKVRSRTLCSPVLADVCDVNNGAPADRCSLDQHVTRTNGRKHLLNRPARE